jgi:uncharacterized protein YbjT (DUF2867 family)
MFRSSDFRSAIVRHGRRPRAAGDEKKTALLKGLPGAAERLTLFQADIYDAATFEPAIQGCEFVFLVATPKMHNSGSSKVPIIDRKSKKQFYGACHDHDCHPTG